MGYKPFGIGYASKGLVKNKQSFAIAEDAFDVLDNAHVFRGIVKRREGYSLLGRFRRDVTGLAQSTTTNTDSYSDADLLNSVRATEPDAAIVPGTVVITIDAGGPNATIYNDATTNGVLTYVSGASSPYTGSGTINYATGSISITFDGTITGSETVDADLSYYPGLPCMGLGQRELKAINAEQTVGFDTKYAYSYSNANSRWNEYSSTATTWSGSNSDFFNILNYWTDGAADPTALLWVTNFSGTGGDVIRYHDGTNWVNFTPQINTSGTANDLYQCRIMVAYRGRLVALNTYEGTTAGGLAGATAYRQRARFSQIGNPIASDAWYQDVSGKGGYVDCPTSEQIVGAEFHRDTLYVGFERSTWALRYTGDQFLPFVWERVNKELGCESTRSMVVFDQGIMYIGDKSINACDGNSVRRIDEQIPDEVFDMHNTDDGVVVNGPLRVCGIRDFYNRLVYWSYPDGTTDSLFPNRVLVFNYETGAWAKFRDSFTAYGNHQAFEDLTWADLTNPWPTYEEPWSNPRGLAQFPDIIAGNQQGFVFVVSDGRVNNDPSLQITGVSKDGSNYASLTIPDHNLQDGDMIKVSGCLGTVVAAALNGNIYQVSRTDADTVALLEYNSTTGLYDSVVISGTLDYIGAGLVEKRENFRIRSKAYNTLEAGQKMTLGQIDFLTDTTAEGEVTVKIFVDYDQQQEINPAGGDSFFNSSISTTVNALGGPNQDKEWQPFYCPVDAQFFQFELTLDDVQMNDETIADSAFKCDAFVIYTDKAGRLVD